MSRLLRILGLFAFAAAAVVPAEALADANPRRATVQTFPYDLHVTHCGAGELIQLDAEIRVVRQEFTNGRTTRLVGATNVHGTGTGLTTGNTYRVVLAGQSGFIWQGELGDGAVVSMRTETQLVVTPGGEPNSLIKVVQHFTLTPSGDVAVELYRQEESCPG